MCLWENGTIIPLGTLDYIPGGSFGGGFSCARGINDKGEIVGNSITNIGGEAAFIWDKNNGMRNLNDFLPAGSQWTELVQATGINNDGQIVGIGYVDSDGDGQGDAAHGFLATPCQTLPAILSLLLGD